MQQDLSDFFRAYTGHNFRANDRGPLRAEFNRLAAQRGWKGDEYRENWCRCLVSEVRRRLDLQPGEGKAQRLLKLCQVLGVVGVAEDAGARECEVVSFSLLRTMKSTSKEEEEEKRRGIDY